MSAGQSYDVMNFALTYPGVVGWRRMIHRTVNCYCLKQVEGCVGWAWYTSRLLAETDLKRVMTECAHGGDISIIVVMSEVWVFGVFNT